LIHSFRIFAFSYVASKSACDAHRATLEELQRQLHVASQHDSTELIQLREAMQRLNAEKERYKVTDCQLQDARACLLTFVFQAAAHALASPFTHMPSGVASVSPATPTAVPPARAAISEERRPSFM
jgi:hypothetical protein